MTKVLVVDDNLSIREALMDTLFDAGYDVIGANNGVVALEKVHQEYPDVILLDVMMPVMDGFEVLQKLKEDTTTQAIPVVLLTAVQPTIGELEARNLGVSHYITKPYRSEIVELTVKVALREAEAQAPQEPDDGGMPGHEESHEQEDEIDTDAFITTGNLLIPLEKKLGGGIPRGSLTLIEGPTDSGKSVICQHFAYGSLLGRGNCVYFTSDHTVESLATQMNSIGLDVSKYIGVDIFDVFPLPEPTDCNRCGDPLGTLSEDISLCAEKYDFIVVDAISNLAAASDDNGAMGLFSTCKRLCSRGSTIFLVTNSFAFEENMLVRLRSLCDNHLKLHSEKVHGKLVKVLETNKVDNIEMNADNIITFQVEPTVGMRILPISRAKV